MNNQKLMEAMKANPFMQIAAELDATVARVKALNLGEE